MELEHTHSWLATCWLCSDEKHWWRAARIRAGLTAQPPLPRIQRRVNNRHGACEIVGQRKELRMTSNVKHLQTPDVVAKRLAAQRAFWARYRELEAQGLSRREAMNAAREPRVRNEEPSPAARKPFVMTSARQASLLKAQAMRWAAKRNGNGNGHDAVATFLETASAEEILGRIQSRIDELTAETTRLSAENTQLRVEQRAIEAFEERCRLLEERNEELRVQKEALDREVFELQKANREQAAELRASKEKGKGLRLFRAG